MKKMFIAALLIVAALIAFIIGVRIQNHSSKNELTNNKIVITDSKPVQIVNKSIVEVPIFDVESVKNGITRQEAENLCSDVLGERAEENGFPISYRCISAVSADNELYYVMHITWLVNSNHWSYIGNCFVASDGQKIYDGVVSQGKYEMTELRWAK